MPIAAAHPDGCPSASRGDGKGRRCRTRERGERVRRHGKRHERTTADAEHGVADHDEGRQRHDAAEADQTGDADGRQRRRVDAGVDRGADVGMRRQCRTNVVTIANVKAVSTDHACDGARRHRRPIAACARAEVHAW